VKERTADLAAAMTKVEKVNAAMNAELSEAANYSRAVLPPKLTTPVFTDWVFISSSQLGGDSFGYHWLDDDTLSIYLLDVCGHGVGAALLSISVVNVLRTSSLAEADFRNPANVMMNLNAAFPMEQHNDMYFTAWYGVYRRSTGMIIFACGGHPPAVLIDPDGTVHHLSAKGAVLGAFPKPIFETASASVSPGSRLYLFSDGAYEIDRPDYPMMTHGEFSNILRDTTAEGESKLEAVVSEVRRQQNKNEFADDFSLMELRFPENHPAGHGVLTLKADLSELRHLHPFLSSYCQIEGTPMEQVFDFEIILEELVTNVIKYGGVKKMEECCFIELLRAGNLLTIRFSDRGNRFNPLDRAEVETDKPIEEREIGGLGIHFIKKLTDSQHYAYKEGKNVLTLTKKLRS